MPNDIILPAPARQCRRCGRVNGERGVVVASGIAQRCNVCDGLAGVCQVSGDAVPVCDLSRAYSAQLRDYIQCGPAGREQLGARACDNCGMNCDGESFSVGRGIAADAALGGGELCAAQADSLVGPVVYTRHSGRRAIPDRVCNVCYSAQVTEVAPGVWADSRSEMLSRYVNESGQVVRVLTSAVPADAAVCSSCGLHVHASQMRRGICSNCRRSGVDSLSFGSRRTIALRAFEAPPSTLFPRITAVGLELETVVSSNAIPDWLVENVPQIGWTSDGSIEVRGSRSRQAAGYGVEFLSQPLVGSAVTSTVRDFAKWARGISCSASENVGGNYGRAWVNRSCGFHVHLDCARFFSHGWQVVQRFAILWATVQADVYRCLPASRRGRYSAMLPADRLTDLATAGDERAFLRAWYGYGPRSAPSQSEIYLRDYNSQVERRRTNKYDESRYGGINLHSWAHRGTIEVRCGSGTVDYLKAARWASVCVHLLKVAANSSADECKRAKLATLVPASVGTWLKTRAQRLHGEALAT